MKPTGQVVRWSTLALVGLAALEVIIMMGPFAGFFYATLNFGSFLGFLSGSTWTAWLDGFFLNHSVVTRSFLLEWQREFGLILEVVGAIGFLLAATRVYGSKMGKRGVATSGLYRWVRHPQYLCLAVAGWGLLSGWPRFLLLGIWITMLFLYAGLARFEERRMRERFGDDYRQFAKSRGSFLPGSPVHRMFEASFGRIRPRALGWAASFLFCLTMAYSLGFALRAHTIASSAIHSDPEDRALIISVWPQPEDWMVKVFEAASGPGMVRDRIRENSNDLPVVVTILTPGYGMKGMYYKPISPRKSTHLGQAGFFHPILYRSFMGRDPGTTDAPLEVVFSRAEKLYRDDLPLEKVLDPDVVLTPLVVVTLVPSSGVVTDVRFPAPQNAWGPKVVMPIF